MIQGGLAISLPQQILLRTNFVSSQRIDAFELWCWKRFLRVPWTARRSNQSILKEINPEYSLEGLMLKLKLQYFGHLIWRADSLEKSLMLGNIESRRRRGQQRKRWLTEDEMFRWHHQLSGHEFEQTLGDSFLKFMSIELVMSSNHLTLCPPLLLSSNFPSIWVFSNDSTLYIRWLKYQGPAPVGSRDSLGRMALAKG